MQISLLVITPKISQISTGWGDNAVITSKEICQAMDRNQKCKIEGCKSRK